VGRKIHEVGGGAKTALQFLQRTRRHSPQAGGRVPRKHDICISGPGRPNPIRWARPVEEFCFRSVHLTADANSSRSWLPMSKWFRGTVGPSLTNRIRDDGRGVRASAGRDFCSVATTMGTWLVGPREHVPDERYDQCPANQKPKRCSYFCVAPNTSSKPVPQKRG